MNQNKGKFPDIKQCPFCTGELTIRNTQKGKTIKCKQCSWVTLLPPWMLDAVSKNDPTYFQQILKDAKDARDYWLKRGTRNH